MNKGWILACAWSGALGVALILGGMVMSGLILIPSPAETAQQTYDHLVGRAASVRIGLILATVGAGLLVGYSASLAVQMKRIEGQHALFSYFQLGSGTLLSLEFIYLIFFWQTATFRADRSPELVQLLNDLAWIPFVGLSSTVILQALTFGIVVLADRQAIPIFPRWLGWYSIFCGAAFTPGSFNMFFMHGPFAWNGVIAIYMPGTFYVIWIIINCIYSARAVEAMPEFRASTCAAEAGGLRDVLGP